MCSSLLVVVGYFVSFVCCTSFGVHSKTHACHCWLDDFQRLNFVQFKFSHSMRVQHRNAHNTISHLMAVVGTQSPFLTVLCMYKIAFRFAAKCYPAHWNCNAFEESIETERMSRIRKTVSGLLCTMTTTTMKTFTICVDFESEWFSGCTDSIWLRWNLNFTIDNFIVLYINFILNNLYGRVFLSIVFIFRFTVSARRLLVFILLEYFVSYNLVYCVRYACVAWVPPTSVVWDCINYGRWRKMMVTVHKRTDRYFQCASHEWWMIVTNGRTQNTVKEWFIYCFHL